MAQVNVTINGKTFRMACGDGEEERVTGLASRLDRMINELRQDFGEIGDQRLTVMAGIMMADDLTEAEKRIRDIAGERDRAIKAGEEAAGDVRRERERGQAALAEAGLSHQTEVSELKRAHQAERQELAGAIHALTERLELLTRQITSGSA